MILEISSTFEVVTSWQKAEWTNGPIATGKARHCAFGRTSSSTA
jgi:hypothetical protein